MGKTIEELRENGCVTFKGREYILTEQPEFQDDVTNGPYGDEHDNYFTARAICLEDTEKDEDGYQKCYEVRWEILPDYDPEYDGYDCACDWDKPTKVEQFGEYSMEMDAHS